MATRKRTARRKRGALPRGVYEHYGTFPAEIMVDGARQRRAGFESATEAAEWLEAIRRQARSWKPGDGSYTLGAAIEAKRKHLVETRRSPETLRFYEVQFTVLERILDPAAPLANLRRQDVAEFVRRRMAEPVAMTESGEPIPPSARTIETNVGTLRAIVNLAKRTGRFFGDNPCSGVELPRVRSQRFDAMTEGELRRALDTARRPRTNGKPAWPTAVWDADVFEFLATTGLRRRGLARLRVADCDPFRGHVTVHEKDGPRVVPLSSVARQCLSRLLAHAAAGSAEFVIPASTEHLRAVRVSRAAARFRDGLGLRLRGAAHVARHTFGTAIANVPGAGTWDVQNALGDKTLAAASRYVHATGERRRELVEAVGVRIAEGRGPDEESGAKAKLARRRARRDKAGPC